MSGDEDIGDRFGEASRWFRFAEEDLRTAVVCLRDEDVPPRQPCYLAQQAAEKALKSCLIACGTDYPRSHDLDYLRNLLPPNWRIHATHPVLAELTEWLVEARYPAIGLTQLKQKLARPSRWRPRCWPRFAPTWTNSSEPGPATSPLQTMTKDNSW